MMLLSCERKSQEVKKEFNVLILGNSITRHGPYPPIKWYGDWGMAASAQDKDYVHLLTDKLKQSMPNRALQVYAENIAYWESDFDYDFLKEQSIKTLIEKNIHIDLLIIRLGENSQPSYLQNHNYEKALIKLIDKFKTSETKVLITGTFWPSSYLDGILSKVAYDRSYPFVQLYDLTQDVKNKALDTYEGGVGEHPSDLGMSHIADRIFNKIIEMKLIN
jgi:hypothetical protein